MAGAWKISSTDTLLEIESTLAWLQRNGADSVGARVASDRRASYFKDIWSAMAVGTMLGHHPNHPLVAWGIKDWAQQDNEDGFALSYPGITALQLGADVLSDSRPPIKLDPASVRKTISRVGGVLGSGGRQRTIVELDPELPQATPLLSGIDSRAAFSEFVRGILRNLEIGIGARALFGATEESDAKDTILEFLYELQTNATEHGRASRNIRMLRLQKHLYPKRSDAINRATNFFELEDYLRSHADRPSSGGFNLIEASVSDFGPGILDGFLATAGKEAFHNRDRRELLHKILHEQLSSKGDPNAGLGIQQALAAAHLMDAFVSLRTAEFWLVMKGGLGRYPQLSFKSGNFAKVRGTHWQLLLPDSTDLPQSASLFA